MIDHVLAEHKNRSHERLYRIYTSDMLKSISEFCGNEVYYKYSDLIKPREEEAETGDEVALRVIKRIGLKGKQNEPTGISSEADS